MFSIYYTFSETLAGRIENRLFQKIKVKYYFHQLPGSSFHEFNKEFESNYFQRIKHHLFKITEKRTLNKKPAPKVERNFLGFAPGIPKEDIDNLIALQDEVSKIYMLLDRE